MSSEEEFEDLEYASSKLGDTIEVSEDKRRCRLVRIERGEPYDDGDLRCVTVTRYRECDDGSTQTTVRTICVRRREK